jgi:hypothetical protein
MLKYSETLYCILDCKCPSNCYWILCNIVEGAGEGEGWLYQVRKWKGGMKGKILELYMYTLEPVLSNSKFFFSFNTKIK